MRVAVVGGTGDFGLALAQRLAEAGDHVVIVVSLDRRYKGHAGIRIVGL